MVSPVPEGGGRGPPLVAVGHDALCLSRRSTPTTMPMPPSGPAMVSTRSAMIR